MIEVKPHEKFPGIFLVRDAGPISLATQNLTQGHSVYGEQLVESDKEYRIWSPYNSKLAAAILKGLQELPFKPGDKVLYLGAATGTTVSHVADILGPEGIIYAVEFSARPARELITNVASLRRNVVPIIADARFPQKYHHLLDETDALYCDVAQPEQARILADNADFYLKNDGGVLLAVKARSIDSTRDPTKIYAQEANVLRNRGFRVEKTIQLRPSDKAHAMILAHYTRKN
jgi:fibrillarin-like pre-rRNA processing protein